MSNDWDFGGIIMEPSATANTNHSAVFDFKSDTYFVYHDGSLPHGSGYRRVACVEKLDINADGTIDPIKKTAVGLTVLAGPVCNLLFSRYDNTNLIRMMMYGSLAVVFFSLSTVTNAVLQGINHMQTPLKNAVISLVLHILVLCIMLFGFKMGIYSVVYSNILFALFMCILNGISIRRFLNYRQEMKKTFILPTIASGIMGGAAYGVYKLVHMTVKSCLLYTSDAADD